MFVVLAVVLVVVVVLPMAWLACEFYPRRPMSRRRMVRILLGAAAILSSFGVALLAGSLVMFNYNAWYGRASKRLIETTVTELEAGRTEEVIGALTALRSHYHPTFESKARYDVLVDDAVHDEGGGKAGPVTRRQSVGQRSFAWTRHIVPAGPPPARMASPWATAI